MQVYRCRRSPGLCRYIEQEFDRKSQRPALVVAYTLHAFLVKE